MKGRHARARLRNHVRSAARARARIRNTIQSDEASEPESTAPDELQERVSDR